MDNFVRDVTSAPQNLIKGVGQVANGNISGGAANIFRGGNVMGIGSGPLIDLAGGGAQPDSSGIDLSGQPNYAASYDPSMAQLPGYEQHVAQNSAGYNKFKNNAMSETPSPWAGLAGQTNQQNATNAMDKGAGTVAGAAAGAMDRLAAGGGLSSGARERVAESGAKNLVDMNQGIAQNMNTNAANIGLQDAQMKQQELSQLPGMEFNMNNAWQGIRGGDQNNALTENQNKNAFNLTKYAAGQQAQATANSGSRGKK